ncbi:Ubiquinone/menaquinone biosynthesis C-methylase UbiE [Chitinophaga terrae (ex Kim and Jung 2007)]|uniref:Ubiquinone/menaquinone biosynthesis C-methylase UbiE n=1 Tax=Chitinophaga terrae (ex Kim and Jung 2007) TaxID=408074 RepID=A0A1H3WZH9_9BACT|nr:class I SAM-dependent methyltransferase [Chitinophaga terrae (ex Kim and Jung 2007)]GEP90209.1 methyltransferase [Chitinophaga terrae (ex Kim and Jung 2007)]SDZ92585.1 Ubiquinone/menaquinone biosynthesis C-methylase UbiE [Chitinophaga terrae (ex Kim and Jung 2007)]
MSLIYHNNCPICGSSQIRKVLTAKDYTVSKSSFDIFHCGGCAGRFTQNVPGPSEIGRYYQSQEYISHSETKQGLINRLYHNVRKITLRSKHNWVKQSTGQKAGSVLDIGSGTGAFLHYMKQVGWEVTGLEPDEIARKNAKDIYGIEARPIEDLYTLPAQQFDAITMWHVLEHVHELHRYLDHLKTLLKPGGSLLIAVPNYTSADASYYQEYWAAYDVPRHLYHFSPSSMEQLLSQHHFTLVKKHPMVFDGFYVSLLSEKYKTGKSRLIQGFLHGLLSYRKGLKNVDRCSSIVYECKGEFHAKKLRSKEA